MKNTKQLITIGLAAALVGPMLGCQTADNKNAVANQIVNKPVTNTNTAVLATPAPTADTAVPNAANSPTEAYKAAYLARKNRDVPALKKLLSKDILGFFSEIAGLGEKKQTLDELLMELCEKPQAPTAEVRNEKIDGDKASIEYLDENGEWDPMEFVKEDGIWKLTIEKADKGAPDDKKTKK